MTVSFGAALMAGLLSFLSPCVLPLVPGYIGFLGGLGNRSNDVSNQAKNFLPLPVSVDLRVSRISAI